MASSSIHVSIRDWVAVLRGAIVALIILHRVVIWLPSFLAAVVIVVHSSAMLLVDRSIVAILLIAAIWIHRLIHCVDFINRAILAAWVCAIGPWSSAIRAVRHACVDRVVRLLIVVICSRSTSVQLRIGCHAIARISSLRRRTIAIAIVVIALLASVITAALHRAIRAWAIVIACQGVGASLLSNSGWILTTEVATPSASKLVLLVPLLRIYILSVSRPSRGV